jgi:hypothetical protein
LFDKSVPFVAFAVIFGVIELTFVSLALVALVALVGLVALVALVPFVVLGEEELLGTGVDPFVLFLEGVVTF